MVAVMREMIMIIDFLVSKMMIMEVIIMMMNDDDDKEDDIILQTIYTIHLGIINIYL